MKYLNSANQNAHDAVGHWMQIQNPNDIEHLRFKSGYFTINGLSSFKSIVDSITANHRAVTAIIGANGKDTLQSDVDALIDLVQHPRATTRIAVAGFSNGLFHPKVYHLTRTDGSQLAYIGSANLTPAGVTGLNVETGLLLDTRDGDSAVVLSDIATSIDNWFVPPLLNQANIIGSKADTAQLVADGMLGLTPPPRITSGAPTSGKTKRPSLKPLLSPAPIVTSSTPVAPTSTTPSAVPPVVSSAPPPATPAAAPAPSPAPAPATSAPANDVLIAEVGKGDRWKQANFPKAVMENYFGVNPLANEHIELVPVDSTGVASPPVDTKVVHVKSVNFRIELTPVNGVAYPTAGKPIAVFRRTKAKGFRYHVYLPGDAGHAVLSSYLNINYVGRADFLKRVVTHRSTLTALTPPINV